jgi:hypothetical protein
VPGPTLDDLEGVVWGKPNFPSGLVTRCHELRCKPVAEFTLADLRLLIGQSARLPILMPRAVAAVEADPLAEAFGYPGDLLNASLPSFAACSNASPPARHPGKIITAAAPRTGSPKEASR